MFNKAVEIKNLNYAYPDGTKALSGINLDILKGESIGLIGHNGAGKTSLLLHLNGILKGAGEIKVAGLTITKENLSTIRSKVGIVFQDPDSQLFMPTVFDDVAFGPINMGLKKEDIINSTHRALTNVDMLGHKEKIAHHLSFGEKKRASIATILSMNPEIIVLDEPTSNLDHRHRKNIITLIKNLNMTKIIASHDMGLIQAVCEKIIIMDKGEIALEGLTDDLFNNKELLSKYEIDYTARGI
ncbi:cobalt ABC transporter ATPase [Candidatus Omnitrophus magneticus]|uniref:Cobalt ABC transporter ATPase n=1 Tax=Candidatus Omnitrophus magneticus TaxID=1609969 RepID=A0A0F0CVD9_9BACT|nr:cobalt ABC transporter ATPase [Candidatus Omnitrophus magneticus]KJJ85395.1 cobalt ABC transporter ATPase [Candidatus Omnitrophus magneticus]